MPENFQINQEDPIYRKKIFDFLKSNFSDFNKSEKEFYDKLDADNTYSSKVYDVISNNFSDFGRKREDFISLMSPVKKKELGGIGSAIGGIAGISGLQSGEGESKLPAQPKQEPIGLKPTGKTSNGISTVTIEEKPSPIKEMGMSQILEKYGKQPGLNISIDPKDPVKSISQSVNEQKAAKAKEYIESIRKAAKQGILLPDISKAKEVEDLDNTLMEMQKTAFPNAKSAKLWLNYNNDFSNETTKLAKSIVDNYDNVRNSFFKTDFLGRKVSVPVSDAAINYYSKQDTDTGEKLRTILNAGKEVPSEFSAKLISDFLKEDAVKELVKDDKAIGQKINEESSLYWDRHPELANEYIIHKIEEARETYGENNWFLNLPGVKSSDRLVNSMVATGDLTPQLKNIYEKYTRPLISVGAAGIETPGLIESAIGTAGKGIADISKSAYELTGARLLRESLLPKGEKERRELSDIATQKEPTEFKGIHKWSNLTGNLIGLAAPISGGAGLLGKALKLGAESTLGEKLATGLVFGHDIYENEIKNNKKPALAYLSALLQTALWTKGSEVFSGLTKGMVKSVSPEISKTLESLQNNQISNPQAAQKVTQTFIDVLKRTGKDIGNSAADVAKIQTINTAISNILNGKFDFNEIARSGAQTFQDMAIGLALPSLLKTVPGARKTITDFHNDILADKDTYRANIKDPEQLKNFDRLVAVDNIIQNVPDLTKQQKDQLRLTELQDQIIKEKAASVPIPELKEREEAKLKELSEEKKKIIAGEMPEEPVEKEEVKPIVAEEVKEEVPLPEEIKTKTEELQQVKNSKEITEGDIVSWKGNQMVVESVNNKGGFDLRGKEDKFYTVKDARITDEEFGGKFVGGEGEIAPEVPVVEKTIADNVADELLNTLGIPKEKAEVPLEPKKYTAENVDTISKEGLSDVQAKVIGDVKNVLKSVSKIVKTTTGNPLEVNVHDTQAGYEKAVKDAIEWLNS
jgi:hypothetical protein